MNCIENLRWITTHTLGNGVKSDWENVIFMLKTAKEELDLERNKHLIQWIDILLTNANMAKRKNCSYENEISALEAFALFRFNMGKIIEADEPTDELDAVA